MHEETLYNKILSLSRNKLFYTKFDLTDSFQNRINLIFIHISFIFIKIKQNKRNESSSAFYQKMFDLIFRKIELNMREIGYGDVAVNKNMKFLVKVFYSILLYCEKYHIKTLDSKNKFFTKHLKSNLLKNTPNKVGLIEYFDNYRAFCFDLSSDSVLSGELNFLYK